MPSSRRRPIAGPGGSVTGSKRRAHPWRWVRASPRPSATSLEVKERCVERKKWLVELKECTVERSERSVEVKGWGVEVLDMVFRPIDRAF